MAVNKQPPTIQIHDLVGPNDIDYAFQLQIQEAIKASLTTSNSPSTSPNNTNNIFRVYFKGLVSHETISNIKMSFAGIGVAIYDTSDCRVFESRKSFLLEAGPRGTESELVELEGLVEALNVAVRLEFKRVYILCDNTSVYQYLTGERKPINKKIAGLVDRTNVIRSNFVYHGQELVKEKDIKFVYTLARDAINLEATKWTGRSGGDSGVTITEPCTICFEYLDPDGLFSVDKCRHRYCFSCMGKHVEAVLLQGKLPKCPHEKCESSIGIRSCKKFLKPELYKIMRLRVKEASIPAADKVYCPFVNCSALMSKTEVNEHTPGSSSTAVGGTGMRKCVECDRLFCINCKVPWHDKLTCLDYMNSSKFKSSNEAKVKSLATKQHWRECIKCKNLVELATGCYHIYCRCGYEFCYTCGAQWINKKPTCKCKLWDERNIIYAKRQRH